MRKERLYYLDMARGLAILLVVLGHILPNGYLKIVITSFHVPLFFVISGCLIKYLDKTSLNIKQKFHTLFIPYLVFGLFNFPFFLLGSGFTIGNIKGLTFSFLSGKGIGALWYLTALFIAEITFTLLITTIKNNKLLFFLICSISFWGLLSISFNNIFLNSINLIFSRSFLGLLFIYIGYIGLDFIVKTNISLSKIIPLSIPFLILSIYNKQVDLYSLIYNNRVLYLLNSISLSYLSILLLKNFKVNKSLIYYGTNSLAIMSTHQNLIILIKIIFNNNFKSYFSSLILFVSVMLLDICLVYIINRYLPWSIGKNHVKSLLSLETI